MYTLLRLIPRTTLRNGLRPSVRRISTRLRPDTVPRRLGTANLRTTPHLRPHLLPINARPFSSSPTNPEPLIVRKGYLAWGFPPRPGEKRKLLRYIVGGTVSLVAITMAGLYITHLEQVPESGRWRAMYFTPEDDVEMAQERHERARKKYASTTVPADHPLTTDIRNIARRILETNDLGVLRDPVSPIPPSSDTESESEVKTTSQASTPAEVSESTNTASSSPTGESNYIREWDIMVVNNPNTINAEVDTGLIIIFTGILSACDDEETLAAVLSHEIAHVVARHTSEDISARFFSFLGLAAIHFLTFSTVDSLLEGIVDIPHPKIHETEADVMSLRILANACYDPQAALRLQRRLGEVEPANNRRESFISSYFATHPSTDVRIKDITKHLPRAMELFEAKRASGTCGPTVRDQMEQFRQAAGLKSAPTTKMHLYDLSTLLLGHSIRGQAANSSRA